jgi:SAM-dependent methyltransferase
VLDLACGQGLATRALVALGAAELVGVDSSPTLVSIAREREEAQHLGIRYALDDAQALQTIEDSAFDLVNCQLGLMDIPDLIATLVSVARVLRARGAFVFVIGHPAFLAPNATRVTDADGRQGVQVHEYLAEAFWRSANPEGVRRVGNYHRPISTYLNGLIAHGFALEVLDEPRGSDLLVKHSPVYERVPIFLGVRARLA